MAAGYPERCGARWLRDGNSFNSFRTDRILLRMSQPPQTLAYATQPVYDNIIVTPCADGVSFTFLPNRRFLRQAIREFVGFQGSASWPRSRITDIVATRVSGRRP